MVFGNSKNFATNSDTKIYNFLLTKSKPKLSKVRNFKVDQVILYVFQLEAIKCAS